MRLLREPSFHFLLIGAAIFGLHAVTSDSAGPEAAARIVITAGEIDRLRSLWHKQWQRPPTAEELRGLIDLEVREEVLYREALALGLDRDDTIIRRRLAQKFEFLTEDLAGSHDPGPAELRAYFEANQRRYRVPPRLTFTQLYFNPDRRGAAAERDARLALANLPTGSSDAAIAGLGDGFMLQGTYEQMTPEDIEAVFGRDFADAVLRLDPGVWDGPIVSGYGLHLVRVEAQFAGRVPALRDVEEQVRNDWSRDQRQHVNETIFQRLLARYDVTIEQGAPDLSAKVGPGTAPGPGQ